MVHPFISSQSLRLGRLGGLTISVAAHTSLIALAVASSGRALSSYGADDSRHIPAERLVFIQPARLVSDAAETAARAAKKMLERAKVKAKSWEVPDLAQLHVAVDKSIAVDAPLPPVRSEMDYGALASDGIVFGDVDMNQLATGVLGKTVAPNAGDAYTEDVVERAVWPRRGNPRPYYPPALMDAGVEGNFVVLFVVDSTGRVDEKTISIPSTAHRMFAAAVREALRRSRYYPAELGGRVVRQLVEQRFVFRLGNR